MGKTALGLNIALNTIQDSKLPVLFFSLEMSKTDHVWLARRKIKSNEIKKWKIISKRLAQAK
jgi:replicative DNA helicase